MKNTKKIITFLLSHSPIVYTGFLITWSLDVVYPVALLGHVWRGDSILTPMLRDLSRCLFLWGYSLGCELSCFFCVWALTIRCLVRCQFWCHDPDAPCCVFHCGDVAWGVNSLSMCSLVSLVCCNFIF